MKMTKTRATNGETVINHPSDLRAIERHALNMRRNIVKMLAAAGSGHAAFALLDETR